MTKHASTEVLFGSVCRGDSDQLSDRDILIVDDNVDLLRSRRLQLQQEGWSVASYTWTKLQKIAAKGALFVQHLKLESQILHDENKRFETFVAEFKPKESYALEISANRSLASLASTYPASGIGALWAADVLYVCIRNYGVLKLAERKQFTFSFHDILDGLVAARCLSASDATSLRQLRLIKSLYRSHTFVPASTASALLEKITQVIPAEVMNEKCRPLSSVDVILRAIPLSAKHSAYHRLRQLEKVYLAGAIISPQFRRDPIFERLRRWIEDPRMYAGLVRAKETDLMTAAKQYVAYENLVRVNR